MLLTIFVKKIHHKCSTGLILLHEKCPYSEVFLSECGEIWTRKTQNTDTFQAVYASGWYFWSFWIFVPFSEGREYNLSIRRCNDQLESHIWNISRSDLETLKATLKQTNKILAKKNVDKRLNLWLDIYKTFLRTFLVWI